MTSSPTIMIQRTGIEAQLKAVATFYSEHAAVHAEALNAYAVVDAGQHPNILASLDALEDVGRANLFEGLPEQSLTHLTPWLLELDKRWLADFSDSHFTVRRLCEITNAWPCISWILSRNPIQIVAEHLRKWFNGIILEADGSQLGAVLVRYYDARTLPGFFSMLSQSQYADFMQPIAAYGLWTRFDTWKQWVPGKPGLIFPAPIPEYSLEQHASFAFMTQTDRLHAMLEEHYGVEAQANEMGTVIRERYLALPQDERYRKLHRLLGRGDGHGLKEETDLFLFASLVLGIHPTFDLQPQFAEAIAKAVTEKVQLGNVLAELPETAWQALDALASAQI